MDIWFTLFVLVVALAVAVGGTLLLVGYINLVPASFAKGKRWLYAVAVAPLAVVVLPMAGDLILVLAGSGMPPYELGRLMTIPAVGVHVLALGAFLKVFWGENVKAGRQLIGGLLLVAVAAGLLYGIGPSFVDRIAAASVK